MRRYNSINKDLIEIERKIYRLVRYFGDVWLIKECNTSNFYLFDRSEEYFFLIQKKSPIPTFVLSDLIAANFVEESSCSFKEHIFKLLRCQANQCLYIVALDIEAVKHLSRVPCHEAEILLHPKKGAIVGVFYEELNVLHVKGGKFVE